MTKIFCLFILYIPVVSYSQPSTLPSTVEKDSLTLQTVVQQDADRPLEYNFFQSLTADFYEQARSPFYLNNKELLLLGGGTIITGALIYFDQDIDNTFSPLEHKHRNIRHTSPRLTEFGGKYGILSTAAFGAYSVIWNDKKAEQTFLLLTEAIVTSGVWVRVAKIIFSRERPSEATRFSRQPGGQWHWVTGFFAQRYESVGQVDAFPSGHTATAFAIAAVIEESYGDYFLVPPIIYTLATAVGVTRMIEHTHWASDVFVGGALGYLCGKQIMHRYQRVGSQFKVETNISLGIIDRRPVLELCLNF